MARTGWQAGVIWFQVWPHCGLRPNQLELLPEAHILFGIHNSEGIVSSVNPERALLHYRIISKIGQGGMGQVYKAEDTKLGRNVAIKLLPSDVTQDVIAKRRLLTEARLKKPTALTSL